jgi:hypothetical protein
LFLYHAECFCAAPGTSDMSLMPGI